MKRAFLLLVPVLLFCACHDRATKSTGPAPADTLLAFRQFMVRFNMIALPFSYVQDGSNLSKSLNKANSMNRQSNDTLFYDTRDNNVYRYGLLADTSHFFAFIYLSIGDGPVPVLVTFTKSGKMISSQDLICNGCGYECGMDHCAYAAMINAGFGITVTDTLHYEARCDQQENVLPGKIDSTVVRRKTGRIDPNGKIDLGETAIMYKVGQTVSALSWADSLLAQYARNSTNPLLRHFRDAAAATQWLFDQKMPTDTAVYLVYQVGHEESDKGGRNKRFVTDQWVYIDSLSRRLFEYNINAESLSAWPN